MFGFKGFVIGLFNSTSLTLYPEVRPQHCFCTACKEACVWFSELYGVVWIGRWRVSSAAGHSDVKLVFSTILEIAKRDRRGGGLALNWELEKEKDAYFRAPT